VLQQMFYFLTRYFWADATIIGWGSAIVFTAIWLACYRPPLLSKPWLWAVFFGGAILAPIAIIITAFPMRIGISNFLSYYLSAEAVHTWSWLVSIPSIFLFGLVWEGAKLLPVGAWWWWKKKNVEPQFGLLIGAVAGAGFGWLLTQWTLNYFILDYNWSWALVQVEGFPAISGFWESFFVLGINIASTALAGWGLAKGWGWKFYLLAGGVYLVTNYNSVLAGVGLVSESQAQFIIASWAVIVVGVTLWLRDREPAAKPKKSTELGKKTRVVTKK
jgi:hypothetical protein